jgi:hypothetical protein
MSNSGGSPSPSPNVMALPVTALPLDVAGLYLVLRIPTAVKVGHVSIVTVIVIDHHYVMIALMYLLD